MLPANQRQATEMADTLYAVAEVPLRSTGYVSLSLSLSSLTHFVPYCLSSSRDSPVFLPFLHEKVEKNHEKKKKKIKKLNLLRKAGTLDRLR